MIFLLHIRGVRPGTVECKFDDDCPSKTTCVASIETISSNFGRCVAKLKSCTKPSDCKPDKGKVEQACLRTIETAYVGRPKGFCVEREENKGTNHNGWCQAGDGREGHDECKKDHGCMWNIDTGNSQGACVKMVKNKGQ